MTTLLLRAVTLASTAAVAVGAVATAAPPASDTARGAPRGAPPPRHAVVVAVPGVAAPPPRASASGVGAAHVANTRSASPAVSLRGRWTWPLAPRPEVLRPFVRPATRYGAGHRGVDLSARVGQRVLAVDDGVVSHVGVVAGRGTVTLVHASGLRSTYEPVDATVRRGLAVTRGSAIGSLAPAGLESHCGASACLHLGALRDADYLDPLELLSGTRVRLLPLQ